MRNMIQQVRFINYDRTPSLRHRQKLKAFLQELFKSEDRKLESLTYIFCSDNYLLEINQQFLQHDFFTDIITFDLTEPDQGITGEIYISIDRVKENASDLDISFPNELHRVLFHGALHLCGYDDKTKKATLEMREKEDIYLKKYFR